MRFRNAALRKEGLTLSVAEVALLAQFEDGAVAVILSQTQELPLGRYSTEYLHTVSLLEPVNPIIFTKGGIVTCMVWSLFLAQLEKWTDTDDWRFEEHAITIPRVSGTIIIPIDPKYYGAKTNTQFNGSTEPVQKGTRKHGWKRPALTRRS